MSITSDKLALFFQSSYKISPSFFVASTLDSLDSRRCKYFHKNFFEPIYHFRNNTFQKFVKKRYGHVIQKWSSVSETAIPFDNPSIAPIWQIWLQGPNEVPPLVKFLFSRVDELAENHVVQRVSLKNIDNFVDIPSRCFDLYKSGKIGPAHFSDIVRVNLLKRYGGIWLDASVLLTHSIPDSVLNNEFWSVKNINEEFPLRVKCVNSTNWCTYFMCAQPNSILYNYMSDMLESYFNDYDSVYEYLLPNHCYQIGFNEIPLLSKEYLAISDNNYNCEILGPMIESGVNESQIHSILNSDTYLFKLSLKANYTYSVIKNLVNSKTRICNE